MGTSPQQMWLHDLSKLEAAITELYDREAAEDPKKMTKGNKRKRDASAKGKKGDDKGEDDGEGGNEEDAALDMMDNPFSDITRWTSGALKAKTEGNSAKKRRK